MSETDRMPLDSAPRRSKFVAWAPEFSAGTASLILTIAGGIFYFGGELKTQRTEIDQVKRDALADASRSKEAIANVAADVKGIQATVNSMNETLAGMKVMQQITQQQATQRAPK